MPTKGANILIDDANIEAEGADNEDYTLHMHTHIDSGHMKTGRLSPGIFTRTQCTYKHSECLKQSVIVKARRSSA